MFRYLMMFAGFAMLILSAHLHIYYTQHSKKIKSHYFRDLSLLFIPPILMGTIWAIYGLFLIIGVYTTYQMLIPEMTVVFAVSLCFTLLNFVYATHSTANGSMDLNVKKP